MPCAHGKNQEEMCLACDAKDYPTPIPKPEFKGCWCGTFGCLSEHPSEEYYIAKRTVEESIADVMVMRQALAKYANPKNWEWFTDSKGIQALQWKGGCWNRDGGDIARAAIETIKPPKKCTTCGRDEHKGGTYCAEGTSADGGGMGYE